MPRRSAAQERRAREVARTRNDIVEAAARVFAEAGYHDATMAAIARAAGFTAASLYTYFESKEEIFAALAAETKRALLASFDEPVPAGLTFAQRLELLLHRQIVLTLERRDVLRIAFDVRPARHAEPDPGAVEYLRRMATFLAEVAPGALRVSPEDAARILFGLLHATLLPWILGAEDREPGPQAARVVDFFLHGLARPDTA